MEDVKDKTPALCVLYAYRLGCVDTLQFLSRRKVRKNTIAW